MATLDELFEGNRGIIVLNVLRVVLALALLYLCYVLWNYVKEVWIPNRRMDEGAVQGIELQVNHN